MIEDALRETFAAHAVQGPQDVVGDRARGRAESAILRAGRIRRRRTISTALASVLVVAIVSLAMFQAVISRSSPSDPTLNAAGDLDPTATGVAPQPSSGQFPSTVTDTPMPIEMASDGEIYKEDKTTLHLTLPAKSEPRCDLQGHRRVPGRGDAGHHGAAVAADRSAGQPEGAALRGPADRRVAERRPGRLARRQHTVGRVSPGQPPGARRPAEDPRAGAEHAGRVHRHQRRARSHQGRRDRLRRLRPLVHRPRLVRGELGPAGAAHPRPAQRRQGAVRPDPHRRRRPSAWRSCCRRSRSP